MKLKLLVIAFALTLSLTASATGVVCKESRYDHSFACVNPKTRQAATCYYVKDCLNWPCLLEDYVYAESNGVPGLQRCSAASNTGCPQWCAAGADYEFFDESVFETIGGA